MKLRIKGNSIRLRLLQSEVAKLIEASSISESIIFGSTANDVLTYTLISSKEENGVAARLVGNEIVIIVPEATATTWASTDAVSIEANQHIEETGDNLAILIEKDMACSSRPDDPDNADAFPVPKAAINNYGDE
jgi:hypothetical protein